MKLPICAFIIIYFCIPFPGYGQNVKDLNGETKRNTYNTPQKTNNSIAKSKNVTSSYSEDGSGCCAGAEGVAYIFIGIGKGVVLLLEELGLGLEIIPNNIPLRIEAWVNGNPIQEGSFKRPRQEIGCRVHYEFWKKGFLLGSAFGGVSNQLYYNKLNFPSSDFGINYMLSFNRFGSQKNSSD